MSILSSLKTLVETLELAARAQQTRVNTGIAVKDAAKDAEIRDLKSRIARLEADRKP